MGTLVALLVVVSMLLVIAGSRAPQRDRPAPPVGPPAPPPPPPPPPSPSPSREPDVIGGWLLGHQIAHGHDGFPGDPLPHGHLGSPADLAFWGSVFDEEDED